MSNGQAHHQRIGPREGDTGSPVPAPLNPTPTLDACPNSFEDPEGYGLYCELHACRTCEGDGFVPDPSRDDGTEHECQACRGAGIDPEFLDREFDEECNR